jgi:general secretion pathway protein K
MRFPRSQHNRGIALVMVMIIIVVFAGMAAMLAYSMKVETKLARNSSWDTELEWLGRSGIEYAKYALSLSGRGGQYDALNQFWAGGTGETNDVLMDMPRMGEDYPLGHGSFKVKIEDCDRKFNINMAAAAPDLMNQALILMGVDATEAPHIIAAIQDWIDRDDNVTMGGQDTESSYYMSLRPPFGPYRAKNGPIDDIYELLRVKYITPEMFYGSGAGAESHPIRVVSANHQDQNEPRTYPIGLKDLFTTVSGRFININTASANVLQLIPDVDGNMAQAIITQRAGPDGVEGNEDDMPFRSIGEISNVPGMNQQIAQLFSRYFATRSSTFEVTVEATIGNYSRTYHAMVRRVNQNQLVTLFMWWQ